MKRILLPIGVILGAAALMAQAPAPPLTAKQPPDALSAVEALQVQNHTLRLQLAQADLLIAQLRAQLAAAELAKERAALEGQILGAHPESVIDWNAGTLRPKPKPPKEPKT
jgi:hypothetical protein